MTATKNSGLVGTGCTICYHSDCYPGTIVKQISTHRILVQEDWSHRIRDENVGDATYRYTRNRDAAKVLFTFRKNGQWVRLGSPQDGGPILQLGFRRRGQDPSF